MKSFLEILLVSKILEKLIFKQSEKRWTKHRRSVDLPKETKKEDAQPCNVKNICLGHSDQTNKCENAKLSQQTIWAGWFMFIVYEPNELTGQLTQYFYKKSLHFISPSSRELCNNEIFITRSNGQFMSIASNI